MNFSGRFRQCGKREFTFNKFGKNSAENRGKLEKTGNRIFFTQSLRNPESAPKV